MFWGTQLGYIDSRIADCFGNDLTVVEYGRSKKWNMEDGIYMDLIAQLLFESRTGAYLAWLGK